MRNDELDTFWPLDEHRARMTDAEYGIWLAKTRAKIAASIADPRPALSLEQVDARLDRLFGSLGDREDDAAA